MTPVASCSETLSTITLRVVHANCRSDVARPRLISRKHESIRFATILYQDALLRSLVDDGGVPG